MKIAQKVAFALALSIGSLPAVAAVWTSTPTKFTPTPMPEGRPMRFLMNIDNANVGSGGPIPATSVNPMNGYLATGGAVGLMNLQLNLAFVRHFDLGIDVGLGFHGGIQSPYSMFFGDVPFPSRYGVMLGTDLMVRYMAMFGDLFYGGIQAQIGYNYTESLLSDAAITGPFGQKSRAEFNGFIPIVAGIAFGADWKDSLALYVFPAIELGQTGNYTSTTAPTNPDTGIWKSAVGMQFGVGTAIHTKMGDIVIQVTPRIANFSNQYSWGFDLTSGMQMDF